MTQVVYSGGDSVMILGKDAIILDVEDARKLLKVVRYPAWDKEKIRFAIEIGCFHVIDSLDTAINLIDDPGMFE